MQAQDLARILSCFSDTAADVDVRRGTVVLQLRDEIIEATLTRRDGDIWVSEDGQELTATSWIIKRIARVPLLAERVLTYIPMPEYFVAPSGRLLDDIQRTASSAEIVCDNAKNRLQEVASRRSVGTASVLYLTSDAGEGKTTLINALAHEQAELYKMRQSDWLLVPISLGGRAFLRFDELIISALVNRYRFQFLYYESFIELVKLGVIVPAFDGFEEMFIEGSSGEAVSALGSLLGQLGSDGSLIVAARRAYFDYQSFKTQAKLFDAIGDQSVSFSRLSLDRWSKTQFMAYAEKRRVPAAEGVFDLVAARLSPDHPLLTRAVLVRRLLDIASNLVDVQALADALGAAPRDYFHQFVNAIISREVSEKWLDKEGREGQTLLSVGQHMDLLAAIAQEMWIACSESLRLDVIDVITDMYCEQEKLGPAFSRQVRERIKTHALLVSAGGAHGGLRFDHEDFRHFFVGLALGRILRAGNVEELRSFLRVASVAPDTADEAAAECRRASRPLRSLMDTLQVLSTGESTTSFLRDNVGSLVVRFIDGVPLGGAVLSSMTFPAQALAARSISNCTFEDCYFFPTVLKMSTLEKVTFKRCKFERIELLEAQIKDVNLVDCDISSVVSGDSVEEIAYRPGRITELLATVGVKAEDSSHTVTPVRELDERILLLERVLRIFLRTTQISDSVIRMRLGQRSAYFIDHVLPHLMRAGVFQEVPHHGSGNLRRFKLGVPMSKMEETLAQSSGEFEDFMHRIG